MRRPASLFLFVLLAVTAPYSSYAASSADTKILCTTECSVKLFGAKGDGVTDDTAAFQAALDKAASITVPTPQKFYNITQSLVLADNKALTGKGAIHPEIRFSGSKALFNAKGKSNIAVKGIKIILANTGKSQAVALYDSSRVIIEDNLISGAGGTAILLDNSSYVSIRYNTIASSGSHAIQLAGEGSHDNTVETNIITRGKGFGIWLTEGAHHNFLLANKTGNLGLEGVGITRTAHHNLVKGNVIVSSGDNGISVTGAHNIITANTVHHNAHNGVAVYGSHNLVEHNTAYSNNQSGKEFAGIAVSAGYGGEGSYNIVKNNDVYDNQKKATQYKSIVASSNNYLPWKPQEVVSASNPYRYFRNKVYVAENMNGVSGSKAPSHTQGIASDGKLQWQFLFSSADTLTPQGNIIEGNNEKAVAQEFPKEMKTYSQQ